MITENNLISAANSDYEVTIRYEYKNFSENSYKFWQIERLYHRGPLQVRWGRIGTNGQVSNLGISLHEALNRKHEKVSKGYCFAGGSCKAVAQKTRISEEFPGLPYGEIRSFRGNDALDSSGQIVMTVPPDVRETLSNNYLLE